MEHFTKKVLLPLIALVLSSVPSLAQITIYHGTTVGDAVSILTNGIQQFNQFAANAPGTGLYVTTDYQVALRYAAQASQSATSAGVTGAASQPYVLEMVLTDGASVGNFVMRPGISNLGAGVIGDLAAFESGTQSALNQFNVINVVDAGYVGAGGETSFMLLHSSAEAYVGVVNPVSADISMMPSASYVGQATGMAQAGIQQAENVIVGNASSLNSDTIAVLENTGEWTAQTLQQCGKICGAVAALSTQANNLKTGLQMGANSVGETLSSSAGLGSVAASAAVLGGVLVCDATLDSLCSNSIGISLDRLLFGDTDTGPTLTSQTFNPYTGSLEKDYSDGSTTWLWSAGANKGLITGVTADGHAYVEDPHTDGSASVFASAIPLDTNDPRTAQVMQVTWPDGTVEYLTQAGFSDSLPDAQDAMASIRALNGAINGGQQPTIPALFEVPSVVPVLDQSGKPDPVQPPDQSGTTTVTGTTQAGNQYTTTVQKDSSGNIVSEYTVTIGTNFTTSTDNLTGTSLTISRKPDGSTSIVNCIQNGTVCATDSGIVNYDDGWNGNNPYDASNQTFNFAGAPSGGGGGGGGDFNLDRRMAIGPGGCDEFDALFGGC